MTQGVPGLLRLYHGALWGVRGVLRGWLRYRAAHGKEERHRLGERRGIPSVPRPTGSVMWFHGASVGESLSLLALLHRVREAFPFVTPLVTTGTVSAAQLMAQHMPAGCLHQYVPLDSPPWVARFLAHWRPCTAVFVESELWPNLILACAARGIPLYLVNANMSEKSFQRWRSYPRPIAHLLSKFKACLAQSSAAAERLTALGAPVVQVSGNLKFAAAPLPYDESELSRLTEQCAGRPLWVAASTHPGEEELIAQAHRLIQPSIPSVLTILIPRHPHRGDAIFESLRDAGFKVVRRSQGEVVTQDTEIYLIDTLGEVGLFYRLSSVAFIGGTLVPIGGHNPIEPAVLGCALIWGVHTQNQDGCTVLQEAAFTVESVKKLSDCVVALLSNPSLVEDHIARAQTILRGQENVLDTVIDFLRVEVNRD